MIKNIQPRQIQTGSTTQYTRLVIGEITTDNNMLQVAAQLENDNSDIFVLDLQFFESDYYNYLSQGLPYIVSWIAIVANLTFI